MTSLDRELATIDSGLRFGRQSAQSVQINLGLSAISPKKWMPRYSDYLLGPSQAVFAVIFDERSDSST